MVTVILGTLCLTARVYKVGDNVESNLCNCLPKAHSCELYFCEGKNQSGSLNAFFVFSGGKTHFLLIFSPVLSLMTLSTLLCSRVLPPPFHICWSLSRPYLNILLFGQQQGEVQTLERVPLMKHRVRMPPSLPQVYHRCSNGISTDLFLLLACCKLLHELQGKLILCM